MSSLTTIKIEFNESKANFDKALNAHIRRCQALLNDIQENMLKANKNLYPQEAVAVYRTIEGEVDELLELKKQL